MLCFIHPFEVMTLDKSAYVSGTSIFGILYRAKVIKTHYLYLRILIIKIISLSFKILNLGCFNTNLKNSGYVSNVY